MLECRKKECTGCGACSAKCPRGAITMKKNSSGFLYPIVDKKKCINCGICNKVCSSIHKIENKDEEKKGFAVQLKDDSLLRECASGGAFLGLAIEVIKQQGVVYGVNDKLSNLEYIKAETIEELMKLVGSKYYQCNIKANTYKEIEQISQNRLVLVSGTPCQISAFKNDFNINKDNLITFEIICQGVPSEKVVKKFYAEKEKNRKKHIKKHIFRAKDRNVGRSYLNKYIYEDGTIDYYIGEDDDLTLSFLRQIFLRKSCYLCKYTNENRISDFTGGDLWEKCYNDETIDLKKGVSILLCNTSKAYSFLKESEVFKIEEIQIDNALKNNLPYHRSVKKPFSRYFSYLLLNLNIKPKIITIICCYRYYIKKCLVKFINILKRN